MEIRQIQSLRRVFLLKLYDVTGGDRWQNPVMFDLGKDIGIDKNLTEKISDYLNQKGFIKINSKDRDISITILGVDEAESYYSDGDSHVTTNEIRNNLVEINCKLDLLTLGQEIIYEDIIGQLGSNQNISTKDLKLVLLSTIFSKGIDAFKIGQIIDIIR